MKKMQPVEGKLDPLPDEGWVDVEDGIPSRGRGRVVVSESPAVPLDELAMLRVRAQERDAAQKRVDELDAQYTKALAELRDRTEALDKAEGALLKAARS